MARAAGVDPTHPRRDLELHLRQRLTDPVHLQAAANALSPEEWQALKVVYWGGAGHGVTVELCHQVLNTLAGRKRQSAINALVRLMDQGFVHTRRADYRQVYFLPAELLPGLSTLLTARMAEQVTLAGKGEVSPEPRTRELAHELCRFLAYVFKTEVQLTQQGVIYRRHQRALVELLAATAGQVEDDPVPGRYPEPLGLVAAFSLERNLATREGALLRPGPELEYWLTLPQAAVDAALLQYWRDRYGRPDLQAFLHLALGLGDAWIDVPVAAAELEPLVHPGQRVCMRPRLEHHLTHFLAPLGVFDLAFGPHGLLCRLTATGQRLLAPHLSTAGADQELHNGGYQFILQPTGEIIAPRPLPFGILWKLELLATLVQRGPALVYRLDRGTVYQALRAGLATEEMLRFLDQHSQAGLPQNLAYEIATWGGAFGQVFFQEACLLRCSDPLLARQIRASRRAGPFVRGELSPTALIIARQDYELLFQALVADGLLPRPGIEPAAPLADAGAEADTFSAPEAV